VSGVLNRVASKKQQSTTKLSEVRKTLAYQLTLPAVRLIAKTSITPTALTWIGFLLTIFAAVLIITENLLAAGFLVLVAGFFDIMDGALARHNNQVTRFGAILDSTLDRLSEAVLLISVLVLYAVEQAFSKIMLVSIVLFSSQLVSYIRARAEACRLECRAGLFTRPERVVVLALGLLLSHFSYALITALAIIAIFSLVTVVQRLLYVLREAKTGSL
jgi:CDP-diacylglycerol--glycerol-3-phosphate 3-phosphatidyltransferase